MVAPIFKDTDTSSRGESYATNAVVMVPPVDFKFNFETSSDNEFQQRLDLPDAEVRAKALAEFYNMVSILRGLGVNVTVMDYTGDGLETPDAVFPNNWFSTNRAGDVILFPMACQNRRNEIRPDCLLDALSKEGFDVSEVVTVGNMSHPTAFLESTGVMIHDHVNRTIYAALSDRCDKKLLLQYLDVSEFHELLSFETQMASGASVYHTNVMMAVGDGFAVICDEIIEEFERRRVLSTLRKTKEVISISEAQMGQFCGNILQLKNDNNEHLIVMSLSAYNAFSREQKNILRKHGKLVPIDVTTIETIGGGSVRCMLAENFLPQRDCS
ncbi:arginine deiminase-related protein [Enterovibrio sp. ZSDZ35]|uniref:Arginine deiminase-related protein n=1 Tax=Enterovibrio qingdaonensis TaxID=2899818 RepID=A0ABT5QMW4_9GAMM|nr:arginine deiminase-related protein [Enterovibrio sp. ZSDZ35]MDD1781830.1 arginine deiminase-related protein [Enterovibrio sp. ZSDZ35]